MRKINYKIADYEAIQRKMDAEDMIERLISRETTEQLKEQAEKHGQELVAKDEVIFQKEKLIKKERQEKEKAEKEKEKAEKEKEKEKEEKEMYKKMLEDLQKQSSTCESISLGTAGMFCSISTQHML